MKKLFSLLAVIALTAIFTQTTLSQNVTVSGALVGNGSYATLTAAFTAINGGVQTGANILISIDNNTDEGTGTAGLNAGTWATLTINPSGARTITGATTAGNPLINLNGADNVTINGLNALGNSLIIQNTTVSATTATSTIRFIADATNNTITNCTILGSSTMAVGTNGGNIYFATATSTGNDNNTISFCNIGPAGVNLPTKGIYGNGSTTTTTHYNSGININNNNIYDYFGASVQSAGIYVAGGNTDWTISTNRFYQTATRTQVTTGTIHAGIQLASTNINNFTITSNTIGYSSSAGTGTYTFVGVSTSSRFYPIYLSSHGTTTATSIQANVITAISISGPVGGTSTSAPFAGILVSSGLATIGNITGNTIGSITTAGSISFTSTSASSSDVYGIYFFPSAVSNISNNLVGGITLNTSSTGNAVFYGLRAFTTSTVTNTFTSNVIGFSSAPITNNSTVTTSRVIGLYSQSGAPNITGNIIRYMSLAAINTGTGLSSSVIGIWADATTSTVAHNVSLNTIHTLSNTGAGAVTVTGMYNGINTTLTTNSINKNAIHSLFASNTAATLQGIYVGAGNATYSNNMIRLGIDGSGNSITTALIIYGIVEATGSNNFYHNSIYIGGNGVGTTANNTIAFNSIVTTSTRAYVNNIFQNSRSNSTTGGPHYGYRLSGTGPNPTGLTTNYNVIYVNGTGGILGFYNAAISTLNGWQTATGQDANSISGADPQFIAPNGSNSTVDLHIHPSNPTPIEGNGTIIAAVTDDYDGETRGLLTPVDIGADAGNFTSAGDINPPTITYSLLNNTSSTSNRAFVSVTITDASGVNVDPGTKPRVYYKRLTDANEYNNNGPSTDGWKYAEANGSSSPFDFTIDYSLLNGGSGVTTGDQVQYFVVAQDLAGTPNVGINSGAFASTPLSVDLTSAAFPIGGTINSYQIIGAPLSGTYTVGLSMMRPLTGRNMEYVAKTRKVKIMVPAEGEEKNNQNEKVQIPEEQMNSTKHFDEKALNRPMIEKEIEETYYELQENGKKYDGPMYAEYGNNRSKKSRSENDNSGSGYVGDALGNYATITAAVTDLNNRGVSGPVTFLLIDANYAGETYPIQFNNNIGGISAVNNVTLKPQTSITATIPGNINANATIRILSNYVTIDGSNSGGTDRSLTIQNNSVTTPSVVLIGSTGTTPITIVTLKNCIITNGVNTSSAVVVSDAGTLGNAGYFNTVTIQNNLIEKAYMGVYATGGTTPQNGSNLFLYNNSLTTSGANAIRFCGLYMQGVNTAIVSQNTISNFDGTSAEDDKGIWLATGCINATVERNNISALNYTGTGGYGGHGILVTTAVTGANVTVKNNMIYNISGDGWDYTSTSFGTDNPIGICIGTHTASTQSGINVFNNSIYLNGNTLNNTNALSMGVFIGNGVTGVDLRNNIIVNNLGLLATTGLGAAGVRMWTSNAQFTNSNYNCYSTNPTGSGTKEIGRIVTTGQTTMAGWRTATTRDAQSFNGLPLFVSATDLHIQSTDLTVSGRGNFIAGNNNDYDGDSRPTSQSTSVKPVDVGCDQYSVSAFATGNVTVLSGSTYFDNNLRAIEIMSGSFTASQVRQFTGVQTPNNTLLRNTNPVKNNNPVNDTKDNTAPLRKTKVKKDGVSGGQTEAMAVNTPWVYWEIDNLTPTTEPITLRYYYNEDQLATIPEANLKLSYWNGSTWDNNFVQSVNAANNYIELTLPTGQSWPTTSLFAVEDASSPLPVILSGFDITAVSRDINLKWSTETEINNKGFSIERRIKTADNQYSTWKEVSFVNGKGNSNNRVEYTYTDKKLNSGAYQYRLKQVDFNGNYEYHSPANNSDVIVGKPGNFDISQNYPNPSNPKSKIDFAMPFDGKVSIKVYDILGKEVATLVNEFKSADFYTVEFDGTNIASGTYFYRIIAEGDNQKFTKTMKMILVK